MAQVFTPTQIRSAHTWIGTLASKVKLTKRHEDHSNTTTTLADNEWITNSVRDVRQAVTEWPSFEGLCSPTAPELVLNQGRVQLTVGRSDAWDEGASICDGNVNVKLSTGKKTSCQSYSCTSVKYADLVAQENPAGLERRHDDKPADVVVVSDVTTLWVEHSSHNNNTVEPRTNNDGDKSNLGSVTANVTTPALLLESSDTRQFLKCKAWMDDKTEGNSTSRFNNWATPCVINHIDSANGQVTCHCDVTTDSLTDTDSLLVSIAVVAWESNGKVKAYASSPEDEEPAMEARSPHIEGLIRRNAPMQQQHEKRYIVRTQMNPNNMDPLVSPTFLSEPHSQLSLPLLVVASFALSAFVLLCAVFRKRTDTKKKEPKWRAPTEDELPAYLEPPTWEEHLEVVADLEKAGLMAKTESHDPQAVTVSIPEPYRTSTTQPTPCGTTDGHKEDDTFRVDVNVW
ncbi:hypothetical protein DFS34DRAFT_645156 [Phlyctochytrium arcticum]|nr:hypothetical protein DFS34DRAFT_645156 [Phlyctochytrium arcticum]